MPCAKSWLVSLFAFSVFIGVRIAAAQTPAASTLDWQPNEDSAIRLASQSNRWVLVHFYKPGDQACEAIERDVYSQPAVREKIQSTFVPLKVNVDQFPVTTKQNGIDRVPTDLLLDSTGKPIEKMNCPTTADAYLAALESASASAKARLTAAQTTAAPTTTPAPSIYATPSPAVVPSAVAPPAAAPNPVRYQTAAQPPATQAPAAALAYNQSTAMSAPAAAPQIAVQQSPPQPPANPAYSDERYAEFYKRWNASQPTASSQQPIVSQSTTPSPNTSIVQAPATSNPQVAATAPPGWGTAGYWGQPKANPGNAVTYNPPQPPAGTGTPSSVAPVLPPGSPPLGLEGYCPVTLIEQSRWQVGDLRWGVIHQGRTYLFTGPMEQKQFLASPDRYGPVMAGRDVVAAVDQRQNVEGQRRFGVKDTDGRIYLFSSAANLQAFRQNASRYSNEVRQAENANRGTTLR